MDRGAYLDQTVARAQAAGYTLDPAASPGQLVAYRSDFRLRWMASKLHTLVVVGTAPEVTDEGLAQFATSSLQWANAAKGQMRGAQVGVGVIAGVIADRADESALMYARKELVRAFAAFAWPVVVDLSSGQRASHTGRPAISAMYTGWMRQQVATLLPAPAAD